MKRVLLFMLWSFIGLVFIGLATMPVTWAMPAQQGPNWTVPTRTSVPPPTKKPSNPPPPPPTQTPEPTATATFVPRTATPTISATKTVTSEQKTATFTPTAKKPTATATATAKKPTATATHTPTHTPELDAEDIAMAAGNTVLSTASPTPSVTPQTASSAETTVPWFFFGGAGLFLVGICILFIWRKLQ